MGPKTRLLWVIIQPIKAEKFSYLEPFKGAVGLNQARAVQSQL